jgi:hypothetical protein
MKGCWDSLEPLERSHNAFLILVGFVSPFKFSDQKLIPELIRVPAHKVVALSCLRQNFAQPPIDAWKAHLAAARRED